MRKNNVGLTLHPIVQNVSGEAKPMQILHIRPDHPDRQGDEHPMAQMLRESGVDVPEHETEHHPSTPKYHPKGGVTIGFVIDRANKIINVAFAKCLDEDTYKPKFGVEKVTDRMNTFDERFTFSLAFDNLLEFHSEAMQLSRGLKRSLIDTITFDHLTKDAVQYVIGQGVARRIQAMHQEYHRKVNELRQEQANQKHLNREAKQILRELPPPPPDMPLH